MTNIINDIKFWSKIMRDHGEFQSNSFAYSEEEDIRTSLSFMNAFDSIYQQALNEDVNESDLVNLSRNTLVQFIQYKKDLLKKLLECSIIMHATPTFINHMINEALEFYRKLTMKHIKPVENNLEQTRLHKVFLSDASGHAKFIKSNLDGIEMRHLKHNQYYIELFDVLYKKATELFIMYDRSKAKSNILNELSKESITATRDFIEYLDLLKKLRSECAFNSSGGIMPLTFEHMKNEGSYYIYQIEQLMNG